jgi:hypothetical protein
MRNQVQQLGHFGLEGMGLLCHERSMSFWKTAKIYRQKRCALLIWDSPADFKGFGLHMKKAQALIQKE